ncbi:MAG: HD domain-containing protein [Flavobacteriia bacterium]|nr:HD domain-containing protein [Flavobacteriia bacterium]OIP45284.1 MAG: phosphohydrolase [Flavobacteriaceae bacterium CG2_30_31_66]PIV98007.1 MAG: phosphohydrolase [Flavobacteriaceae bacterium CG17_big_fil_post_rev_8_21_14_2_50_31_13]PIX12551.1 MAG: phosphohydrolase [Flavobacteriaceae bacterium CG_4_8_14_3_um_filter_31_8]PIY14103.1 MAG: phosphohydrolase [Flavobacteriaceae bacterium CG_4_10_14_3_um_filter_31_253]PIZ10223.1 MAG: phosphohydrolase [Flavobacteriaceae bacterium CG_4_10_14_0_8_um_f
MDSILQKAENYVLDYLNNHLKSEYVYHNFHHTQFVVSKVNELIQSENLTEDEQEIVQLAAWFHDIGYTVDKAKHEDHSITIVEKFLKKEGYDKEKLNEVIVCINATKLHETPKILLEEILCDADFSHLASPNYMEISNQLQTEFENIGCGIYSKKEWLEENIKVFNNHKYYTKYAHINWNSIKNENLIKLKKELKKTLKKEDKVEKEKSKENKSEKSAETLFKITSTNHLKLSYIADRKANILLSVNAIILSISLSQLIPKLDNIDNAFLVYPTMIFVSFSVISIILSVIVTRPSVTSGKFTKEDIVNKKVNLLFFGNFHKMELNEFEEGLKQMANDKEYMFSAMTKDLYFLGKVLDRKYRLLRLNYTVFMIGIIVSVLAFAISYKLLCHPI